MCILLCTSTRIYIRTSEEAAGDGLLIPIVTILDREIAAGCLHQFVGGPLMNLLEAFLVVEKPDISLGSDTFDAFTRLKVACVNRNLHFCASHS